MISLNQQLSVLSIKISEKERVHKVKKDYFQGAKTIIEVETMKIDIEEKIHDEMPKYEKARDFSNFNFERINFDIDSSSFIKELKLKEKFNQIGMFGFVSWRWINPFAEWLGERKCLEVMSGRGWLSKALREKGKEVIATDNYSWLGHCEANVTDVEKLDAVSAVEKYGKDIDILIMCWPFMDNVAYQTIKRLYEVNPQAIVVYIGEGGGGCTADEKFHDHFGIIDDEEFYEKVASMYQSWEGIHDRMYVGKYSK